MKHEEEIIIRMIKIEEEKRAKELANKLHVTNKDRQELTFDSLIHAKNIVGESKSKLVIISVISDEPQVNGLIAGPNTE